MGLLMSMKRLKFTSNITLTENLTQLKSNSSQMTFLSMIFQILLKTFSCQWLHQQELFMILITSTLLLRIKL